MYCNIMYSHMFNSLILTILTVTFIHIHIHIHVLGSVFTWTGLGVETGKMPF